MCKCVKNISIFLFFYKVLMCKGVKQQFIPLKNSNRTCGLNSLRGLPNEDESAGLKKIVGNRISDNFFIKFVGKTGGKYYFLFR